jgi:hypothetical protein
MITVVGTANYYRSGQHVQSILGYSSTYCKKVNHNYFLATSFGRLFCTGHALGLLDLNDCLMLKPYPPYSTRQMSTKHYEVSLVVKGVRMV